MLFKNINVYSDKMPKVQLLGYDETHKTENIVISNLYLNGEPITELSGDHFVTNEFVENVSIEVDPYA